MPSCTADDTKFLISSDRLVGKVSVLSAELFVVEPVEAATDVELRLLVLAMHLSLLRFVVACLDMLHVLFLSQVFFS